MITSTYYDREEHAALHEAAARLDVNPNALQRIALRKLLGLALPAWALEIKPEEEVAA